MKKFWTILSGTLIIVFLAGAGGQGSEAQAPSALPSSIPGSPALRIHHDFGKMPLYFIPNQGQMDARVAYYIQGRDKTICFTSEGLTYVLTERSAEEKAPEKTASVKERLLMKPADHELQSRRNQERFAVKLDFVGANADVRPSGEAKTDAVISYFRGKPEEWITGLPTYSRIVYKNLWPGIDVAYYGTVDKMKYEFTVHPGSDPSLIQLAYRGASAVSVNGAGRLEVRTPTGGFEDDRPVGSQEIDGKRVDVGLRYLLEEQSEKVIGSAGEEAVNKSYVYGFDVGAYDRTKPLVLDPAVLVYCGYIGGSSQDYGNGIAVDGSGNAYITGEVWSTEATFPAIGGPALTNSGNDAFVAKVNASGTGLVYCGFIGGSSVEIGWDIAVDGSGNAYVTGETRSSEATFPVIGGPDLTYNGNYDAFVAKVNASGTGLVYCGYIGGTGAEQAFGIAVDESENAYITGTTDSTQATFPVISGPDLTYNNNSANEAFVAKVNAFGTGLVYCGYIGGTGQNYGNRIAVDGSGNAYVTGLTQATEAAFPVIGGPDLTHNGGVDVFVAKVNASGAGLVYCGYIGGSGDDYGYGVAVDGSGHAYITGYTTSTQATFPVIGGPDLTHNGGYDAFVAKVNPTGTGLVYCGYIGGSDTDWGYGIAVDGSGNAHVTGVTTSTQATFPVIGGPDLTYNGNSDAFVAKVTTSGMGFVYCGYIGGSSQDSGTDIAVDNAGNAYVTGSTGSTEATFPVTGGPDLTYNGFGSDAFVAKINDTSSKDNLLGTWDGQGVYFRDSDTGTWAMLSSPADLIACGDLYGDGIDDLIGIWSGQAGVWVKNSANGSWAYLGSSPRHIAAGDMNGDGRADLLGTWDGQGVFYRDSMAGTWNQMATPATLITAGDLDGDNKSDLIGIWPSQAGVWAKFSQSDTWSYIGSSLRDMATGDMNGDGRTDLVGTWDGQGVFYRDSMTGNWVMMATPADQVAAGDLDGDGTDDLIGIWAGQAGVWVKYSATGNWAYIGSSARDIATGRMSGGLWGSGLSKPMPLASPMGGFADGPSRYDRFENLSSEGPGGNRFILKRGENLVPKIGKSEKARVPGPGESGFRYTLQKNLWPQAVVIKK